MRGTCRALALLVAVGLLAAGTACDQIMRRSEEFVLSRIGYGPDAWTIARFRELGFTGYIEEQLAPETIGDSALETEIATLFPDLSWPTGRLRNTYTDYANFDEVGPGRPRLDLAQAAVIRALRSHRQLVEVLVDFWFNHLNVDGSQGEQRWSVVTYERDAIRPYVLGHFADMLRASSRHSAMLDYLDNAVNYRAGQYPIELGGIVRDWPWGPNENYAREILELQTVGVGAPYTLTDIHEVARVFTGFTHPFDTLTDTDDGMAYAAAAHDTGEKNVMGELHIPAGGDGWTDSEALIQYLAMHPLTAQRLARKLCQRFVSETPSDALVNQVAQRYLETGGDLREVMRTILFSHDFVTATTFRMKVKRPLVFVASLARAIGVSNDAAFAAQMVTQLQAMGHDLFAAAPPTGFPETSGYWVGEGPLVARANTAYRGAVALWGFAPLAPVAGTTPAELVDELSSRLVHGYIDPPTRTRLIALANELPPSARVSELVASIAMSPEFQLH